MMQNARLLRAIAATIAVCFLSVSCSSKLSVKKRRYQPGYYVAVNHGAKKTSTLKLSENTTFRKKAQIRIESSAIIEPAMSGSPDVSLPAVSNEIPSSVVLGAANKESIRLPSAYRVKSIADVTKSGAAAEQSQNPSFDVFSSPTMILGSFFVSLVLTILFLIFIDSIISAVLSNPGVALIIFGAVILAALVVGLLFVLNTD